MKCNYFLRRLVCRHLEGARDMPIPLDPASVRDAAHKWISTGHARVAPKRPLVRRLNAARNGLFVFEGGN